MLSGWIVAAGSNFWFSARHELALGQGVIVERINDRLHFLGDQLATLPRQKTLASVARPWENIQLMTIGKIPVKFALLALSSKNLLAASQRSLPDVWSAIDFNVPQGRTLVVMPSGSTQWLVAWQKISQRRQVLLAIVNNGQVTRRIWGVVAQENGAIAGVLLLLALGGAFVVAELSRRAFRPLMGINNPRAADALAESTTIKEVGQLARLWGGILQQRHEEQDKMAWLADHDPLTGIFNRRGFLDHAQRMEATSQGRRLIVAVADIDHFKQINDTYGHAIGDQLLDVVSRRLAVAGMQGSIVGRLGGDEFALICPQTPSDIVEYLTQVCQQVSKPIGLSDVQIHPTLSVGAAVWPDDGATLAGVLHNADLALYASKARGRNATTLFTPDLLVAAQMRVQLRHRMVQAMAQRDLVLFYQPIVDLKSGHMIGAEALLRWQEGNVLHLPAEFLPYLDDEAILTQLGDYVLQAAMHQASVWHREGYSLRIGINVLPQYFLGQTLVVKAAKLLNQYGLPRGSVELEVTASAGLADIDAANQRIRQLQKLGLLVAIDEFGTGYASLSYLLKLAANHVKLDRSFVRDLRPGTETWIMVGGVVALCRAMRQNVVVQGIEYQMTSLALHNMGAQEAQGEWFAPAMPADRLPGWMARWQKAAWKPPSSGNPAPNLLILLQYHVMQWAEQVVLFAKSPGTADERTRLLNHVHCPCGDWLEQLESTQLHDAAAWAAFRRVHARMHYLATLLLEHSHPPVSRYQAFDYGVQAFLARVQEMSREVLQQPQLTDM